MTPPILKGGLSMLGSRALHIWGR